MHHTRLIYHLLPNAISWRSSTSRTAGLLLSALSQVHRESVDYIDDVFDDLSPDSTRALAEWEREFGLSASIDDAARRLQLAAEWKATGGQSPRYLQDVVQAAGFDLYVHEWWASGPPWVAHDPRTYTERALIGTTQCGEPLSLCGEPGKQCNRFLANDVGYLVNRNLTNVAPPPVPDNPATWPYFLYWCGASFPDRAFVPASRRAELERLLLKICPAQQWLVTLVDYGDEDTVLIDNELVEIDGQLLRI